MSALGGFGEPLRTPHDLSIAVVVGDCGDHDCNVLEGFAPGFPEVDSVDEHIGIGADRRTAPLCFDRFERFAVGIGDGGCRNGGSPEDLQRVFDHPGGHAFQEHLGHGLLHDGPMALVVLDYDRGEACVLGLRHPELCLLGGGREPAFAVTSLVRLAVGRALVSAGLYQVIGLLHEKGVQGILGGFYGELLGPVAHSFLVECSDWFGRGFAS